MNGSRILGLLLLALLPFMAQADENRDPYKFFFAQTFGDYSEELINAKEDGKKGVFLFFEMDECQYCHYMKTTILNKKSVQDYFLKEFAAYSIDIEGDVMITTFDGKEMKMKEYAGKQHMKVRATPVMAFFDLQGKQLHRHTGKVGGGKEEFLWMADYIAQGHYKKIKYTKYKRQRKRESRNRQ